MLHYKKFQLPNFFKGMLYAVKGRRIVKIKFVVMKGMNTNYARMAQLLVLFIIDRTINFMWKYLSLF